MRGRVISGAVLAAGFAGLVVITPPAARAQSEARVPMNCAITKVCFEAHPCVADGGYGARLEPAGAEAWTFTTFPEEEAQFYQPMPDTPGSDGTRFLYWTEQHADGEVVSLLTLLADGRIMLSLHGSGLFASHIAEFGTSEPET